MATLGNRTYGIAILLLLFFGLANKLFWWYTPDIQIFVHDFSEIYGEGDTRTERFLYHLGIMVRPAILCWLVYKLSAGLWKIIFHVTFLFFLKESADVIFWNNMTSTYWYELIVYLSIIAVIIITYRKFLKTKQNE